MAQTIKPPSVRQRNFLRACINQYAELPKDVEDYLAARGIHPPVAARWKLGYVSEPMDGHEGYRDRLAIPYLTRSGPVTMTFRCLKDHDHKAWDCPKYLAEDGVYRPLFNAHAFTKPSGTIYAVEGELDAVVASSLGYPTVGCPGAGRWEKHWDMLFDGFENVVALCDGDKAGREWGKKFRSQVRNATVRVLPDGHDTSSLVAEEGPEALDEWMVIS
ncbi:MAG TPA: toprim domain-containing protein [Candidatus Saccharimonadales bacterium]|nr:toprim domain-containing protein [Candidatus Saccharimonadales bacterium]